MRPVGPFPYGAFMKVRFLVGAFAAMFAVTLGLAPVGAEGSRDEGGDEARVRAGLQCARKQGIELAFKKRNKELDGLGSDLVNAVGGCNDCHTSPPFTTDPGAFLGAGKQVNLQCYMAGGTPFGPPLVGLPPYYLSSIPGVDAQASACGVPSI